MLARQAVLRQAALPTTRFQTQRTVASQIRPLNRRISFLPWRQRQSEPIPVYFSKPDPSTNANRVNPVYHGSAIQAGGEEVKRALRRAKWTIFRYRLRRAIFTTIVLYACWQIFIAVVFDPIFDWADAEWEALSEKEKEEAEALHDPDEPLIFLPFPFTTKEVKQPPYRGSDPEWQTFVKVSQDKKLLQEIKNGLANEIKRGVERNPAFNKLLGGEITVRKYWLDIIFPPAPPPIHYVSGIMIDEEGIFWGDRPIDSIAASFLAKALYPKALAMGCWTFVSFLTKQVALDISKAIGLSEPDPPESGWHQVPVGNLPGIIPPPAATRAAVQHDPKAHTAHLPPVFNEIISAAFGPDAKLDPRLQAASMAGALAFLRHWKPTKSLPSRGCIRVDGIVELKGKTAVMAVLVAGYYDPKTRQYVAVQTMLKHLMQLRQRPAPG
ncbi:hypothetical protein FOPG_00006 [Fusarium oxysporum f. sp. conglutinans race 2 54008]|uniref:Uncharacterized protein n=2 Tax=Fusarium oxysporum f. sp. conglutinans TaxID=100902 RepID=A0A8H6LRU3_FUSOX|nr:hypothetical protein FOPG_00006 [Fusarium oxysporum f. sp. conglutinans race 2 54008]KAF6530119.1 hypothetical protein HZS61_001431 [Fusarium oxysporum f. sp. conglutinans]KAG6991931.1 hypothetical protein FocnCong_v018102 [Fusarium oxysporum f. sp. conglutinans]